MILSTMRHPVEVEAAEKGVEVLVPNATRLLQTVESLEHLVNLADWEFGAGRGETMEKPQSKVGDLERKVGVPCLGSLLIGNIVALPLTAGGCRGRDVVARVWVVTSLVRPLTQPLTTGDLLVTHVLVRVVEPVSVHLSVGCVRGQDAVARVWVVTSLVRLLVLLLTAGNLLVTHVRV